MVIVIIISFFIMMFKYGLWKGMWLGGLLGFLYIIIDILIIKKILIKPCDSYCGFENLILGIPVLTLTVAGAIIYGIKSKKILKN